MLLKLLVTAVMMALQSSVIIVHAMESLQPVKDTVTDSEEEPQNDIKDGNHIKSELNIDDATEPVAIADSATVLIKH